MKHSVWQYIQPVCWCCCYVSPVCTYWADITKAEFIKKLINELSPDSDNFSLYLVFMMHNNLK